MKTNRIRKIALIAVVTTLLVFSLSACGGGSDLVGRWEVVETNAHGRHRYVQFNEDGTGVEDGRIRFDWETTRQTMRMTMPLFGTAEFDYTISGDILTITDSTTGVFTVYRRASDVTPGGNDMNQNTNEHQAQNTTEVTVEDVIVDYENMDEIDRLFHNLIGEWLMIEDNAFSRDGVGEIWVFNTGGRGYQGERPMSWERRNDDILRYAISGSTSWTNRGFNIEDDMLTIFYVPSGRVDKILERAR
ncbi:MAG: hypothetical protein FWB98_08675 [Defluviitaleaceae bacterium]|nr:hypothetical protein [Defluviitaleaceae bacterium]